MYVAFAKDWRFKIWKSNFFFLHVIYNIYQLNFILANNPNNFVKHLTLKNGQVTLSKQKIDNGISSPNNYTNLEQYPAKSKILNLG